MGKFVAFIRGIGPGDPRKSNQSLVRYFEEMGFGNVSSFISSGNILFESERVDTKSLEKEIEDYFEKKVGFEGKTFIKSKEDLAEFVQNSPFGDLTHSSSTYLTVTFLKETPSQLLESADNYQVLPFEEKLKAICCVVDNTRPQMTNFMQLIEKKYGKNNTTRTFNTIQRITAKL